MGGRRYNNEPKLNMKKVIGVIVALAVIIMFIITFTKLLQDSKQVPTTTEKTSYFSVYTNNKWGVIDNKANIVIEPTYEEMILVPNKENPVFICTYDVNYENNTYKTKVINEKGEEILKGYTNIQAIENTNKTGNSWYENNCFKVEKDGKFGLVDYKGKELLNCAYDSIEAFSGVKELLLITKEGKTGLCNIYGKIILNLEYKEISPLGDSNSKQFIIKNDEDKYGIVGSDKAIIVEPIYDQIASISGKDLYVVKENGNWAVINKDKTTNIQGNFDEVKSINDSYIIVKKDNKYGVINTNGEEKIEPKYEDLKYAYGEYFIAKENGKFGIIDLYYETKVEFNYTNITFYQEPSIFIADKEDLESDFINSDLQVKTAGILSKIDIAKGYLRIREDGEYKYYNFKFEEKKNTEVLNKNTLFLAKKDGKYGYINNRGEIVVDYQYDDATEQNDFGYVSVNINGKWGSLDAKGNKLADTKYNLENNELIDFIGKWHLGVDAQANYYTDI